MIENYRDEFDIFYDEENEEVLGIDEEIKLNHGECGNMYDDSFPGLNDDIEEDEEIDDTDEITAITIKSSLLHAIQSQMRKPEYNRTNFRFIYRGEEYSGIPLQKINEEKYIFLIDKKMKGIHLDEMTLL